MALFAAIMASFERYKPLVTRYPELKSQRTYQDSFHIYRVFPTGLNAYDSLYTDKAVDTDEEVAALLPGAKLDAIFIED